MEDKFFTYAIAVSLVIHLAFFSHFYLTRRPFEFLKRPAEMAYNIVKPPPKPETKPEDAAIDKLPNDLMEKITGPLKALAESQTAGAVPQPQKLDSFIKGPDIMDNAQMVERKPERLKGVKVTKDVQVPMLKSDKINTPSYIGYYEITRGRIRESAYANYTKLAMGEVYITFIVMKDGSLGQVQIIEDKSTANDFLKQVALKSVQEAAPFPPLPKDLNYPELTFNVSISFQYHEE